MIHIFLLIIIGLIGLVSLSLGVVTFWNFCNHPLIETGRVRYTGGKFWLAALACLLVLYLKT